MPAVSTGGGALRTTGEHLAALLALVGLAVVTVAPGLFGPPGALVGDVRYHPFDSAWLYASVHEALGRWPPSFHTDLLRTPERLDLLDTFADIANPTLAAPLVGLLGAARAYDLVQVGQVFLAGAAAYALGRVVLGAWAPALAAGALFAAASPLWFALRWGEDDVAAMWVLPAFLALCQRAAGGQDPPAARQALAPGLMLGIIGYFNSYYLYFSAISALLLASTLLPRVRRAPGPWLRFAGAGGLAALVVYAPRLLLGVRPSRKGGEQFDAQVVHGWQDLVRRSPTYDDTSSLDLADFLLPHWLRPGGGPQLAAEGHLYVGLAVLALALVGLTVRRARPPGLLLVGAVGFVLSLGAYLLVNHRTPGLGPLQILPMPGGVLTSVLPGLDRMHHPFRFVHLSFVVLAVLAAAGAARLATLTGGPGWLRGLLTLLLAGGAVAERVVASPELVPLPAARLDLPGWLSRLPESPDQDGLLHLPMPLSVTAWVDPLPSRYHRAVQLLGHGRPIYVFAERPLVQRELAGPALQAELDALVAAGVGVVLLDGGAMDGASRVGVFLHRQLDGQLGVAADNLARCGLRPVELDPGVRAVVLPAAPRCPP